MPMVPLGPAPALPQGQLACPTEGVCQRASLHPRHLGPQTPSPHRAPIPGAPGSTPNQLYKGA